MSISARDNPRLTPGLDIAEFLKGLWRDSPAPWHGDEDKLTQLTPLLLGSGAGGLGWRRVRGSDLRATAAGLELQQAYRLHTLRVALCEHRLPEIFNTLRGAGIEPLLLKGWACARMYPEKGLRPFGDIDLYVRPDQQIRAAAALEIPVDSYLIAGEIDLKNCLPPYYEQTMEQLFEGSQLVIAGQTQIRIAGAEDHLRILCIHFLRHGAWRPLWLCDIAAALENRTDTFDWDRCLGQSKRCADLVACAIGLAHQIFEVPVTGTPVGKRANNLPRWLLPAVLKQWDTPRSTDHTNRELMKTSLGKIERVLPALCERWPNPLEIAVTRRLPLSNVPPTPWQLARYLQISAGFLRRMVFLQK